MASLRPRATRPLYVSGLGGEDWRREWSARRPDAPRWFLDDRSNLTAELGQIDIPTLLLFGDADPIAPVAVGEFLAKQLPLARLEVIPGATHDLLAEAPVDLAQSINAFLAPAV